MKTRIASCYMLVAVLMLFADAAHAYSFVPEDEEWERWPGFCKAKYVWTVTGARSKFSRRALPSAYRAELAVWEKAGIYGLHHYCTGQIWLDRSRLEQDPSIRKNMLQRAYDETEFTYSGSNPSSFQYAYVASQMAVIYFEQGNSNSGLEVLEEAIAHQPKSAMLYSVLAVFLRKVGRTRDAKELLLTGNDVTSGESAEINYNLGLISLEMDEVDEAVQYARRAYELGYPLPGLRKKLVRLGHDPMVAQADE